MIIVTNDKSVQIKYGNETYTYPINTLSYALSEGANAVTIFRNNEAVGTSPIQLVTVNGKQMTADNAHEILSPLFKEAGSGGGLTSEEKAKLHQLRILQAGNNITFEDNPDGTRTINSAGGGVSSWDYTLPYDEILKGTDEEGELIDLVKYTLKTKSVTLDQVKEGDDLSGAIITFDTSFRPTNVVNDYSNFSLQLGVYGMEYLAVSLSQGTDETINYNSIYFAGYPDSVTLYENNTYLMDSFTFPDTDLIVSWITPPSSPNMEEWLKTMTITFVDKEIVIGNTQKELILESKGRPAFRTPDGEFAIAANDDLEKLALTVTRKQTVLMAEDDSITITHDYSGIDYDKIRANGIPKVDTSLSTSSTSVPVSSVVKNIVDDLYQDKTIVSTTVGTTAQSGFNPINNFNYFSNLDTSGFTDDQSITIKSIKTKLLNYRTYIVEVWKASNFVNGVDGNVPILIEKIGSITGQPTNYEWALNNLNVRLYKNDTIVFTTNDSFYQNGGSLGYLNPTAAASLPNNFKKIWVYNKLYKNYTTLNDATYTALAIEYTYDTGGKGDIVELQEGKQNKLVAGTNITLTNNEDNTTTISASGGASGNYIQNSSSVNQGTVNVLGDGVILSTAQDNNRNNIHVGSSFTSIASSGSATGGSLSNTDLTISPDGVTINNKRVLTVDDIPSRPVKNTLDLSSQIDGTTQVFTLDQGTTSAGSNIMLFYNGLLQTENKNYTIAGSTLTTTFTTSPQTGDELLIIYYM